MTQKLALDTVESIPPAALPQSRPNVAQASPEATLLFVIVLVHRSLGAICVFLCGNVQVLWFSGGGGVGGTSPMIWRVTLPM